MAGPARAHQTNLPFHDAAEMLRTQLPLPFEHLIEDLRGQDFIIGVDHILRLQCILRALGPQCGPRDLKSILCPIFATSARQQELFQRTYDRHFNLLPFVDREAEEGRPRPGEGQEPSTPKAVSRWRYVACALLLIVLAGSLVQIINGPVEPERPPTTTREIPVPQTKGGPPRLPDKEFTIPLGEIDVTLTFWQRYGAALKTAAVAAPLLLFLALEWYRRARRRIVLERGKSRKPPYIWPIQLSAPAPGFLKTEQFYRASRRMQERLEGDVLRFDVDKTVKATLSHAGFASPRYRPVTHPPEYLVLIDLPTPNDHHAGFADTLARMLQDEGGYIHRYFYSEDPQVCFEETGKRRRHLSDLQVRFSRCRLILVGDCGGLLNPMTGEAEPWTEMFRFWPGRAILTPLPPRDWGMREVTLADVFAVLPASLEGLESLVDHFELPTPPDMRRWVRADMVPPGLKSDQDDLQVIRTYLGDEGTFRWLCACAVYPELNWRLTLYLGLSLGEPISESSLLHLMRLPWLRQGSLPDGLREKLIASLHPDRLAAIRQSIFDKLEKAPPPVESGAWETYQLNLAIHRSLLARDTRERLERTREVREKAREVGESRVVRDYTLLKLLESERVSPLSLVLPKRLHRLFFRNGLPLFGVRTWAKAAAAALLSVLFLAMPAPQKPFPSSPPESLKLMFAHIPAGKFVMGSPEGEPGHNYDEISHDVTLTRDFYLQATEVTQGQWKAVMGGNPSSFDNCGDDCPVENVSWEDAQEFIRKLNRAEGKEIFRLPTEAEWEYAARAGSKTAFANGGITFEGCDPLDPNLDTMGWYCGNAGAGKEAVDAKKSSARATEKGERGPRPVGGKKPNIWGLYDMHGNVWEWCQDWFGDYPFDHVSDPTGPEKGSIQVIRGGAWSRHAVNCRSAYRGRDYRGYRDGNLGFRLARSLP
jgi:formylglycine-generating enzyme required for sulfatase activity